MAYDGSMNTDEIDGTDFQLNIRLGNAAMLTASDIAAALRKVADRLDEDGVHGSAVIMDENGARVGNWSVR